MKQKESSFPAKIYPKTFNALELGENALMLIVKKSGLVLFVWTAVAILYAIRIPMAYKSFWAEDGNLFYQDAIDRSFSETLKSPGGGYFLLVGRLIGKVTSFFPVENVTIINFLLACLVTALGIIIIFEHTKSFLHTVFLRSLLAVEILFNPIASFDSLANSANLHFTLTYILMIILISARRNDSKSGLSLGFVILACLSDPLCVFCLPALLDFKIVGNRFKMQFHKSVTSAFYLGATTIQLLFTAFYLSQGSRRGGQEHSIVKTGYLFLDRVVGSTFIPGWGRISSGELAGGSTTVKLLVRASVATLLLLIWGILYFRIFRVKTEGGIGVSGENVIVVQLLTSLTSYWFISGIVFNPEPRYGIFPALCLLTAVALTFDQYLLKKKNSKKRKTFVQLFCLCICATWLFSWSPSAIRTIGPEWKTEIRNAAQRCIGSNKESEQLRILPESANWKVVVPCTSLKKLRSEPN